MKTRIAVIGAGIAGLALAQRLKNYADVVVYEKARGVGGRMSARYADPFYFDHGTQYFTARRKAFQQFLTPFMDAGIVAEWRGKVITLAPGRKATKRLWFEPHFVACPNMNSVCRKLAEGVTVNLSVEVAPLAQKRGHMWELQDKDGNVTGAYDWVISTAPPAQTLQLLHTALPADTPLHLARMQGCYAVMMGFHTPWDKPWIAAEVRDNPIRWIAINSSKPGRNNAVTCIVAHSRHDWAEQHMDDDMQEAQHVLLQQFEAVTGIVTANADYISTHRWKYAVVEATETVGFYLNPDQRIAATGDWASASRIEDAWCNANGLANAIIKEC
jgi:predicted NAD/FAD-dependent oxidoreductase